MFSLPRSLTAATLLSLVGCSLFFGEEPHSADLSKVREGQTRAVVEEELGEPVWFGRATIASGASHVSVFELDVREFGHTIPLSDSSPEHAAAELGRDEITVYYDVHGKVVAVYRRPK